MFNNDVKKAMKNIILYAVVLLCVITLNNTKIYSQQPSDSNSLPFWPSESNAINLKEIPFKIMHESYVETEGRQNWELFIMNADDSNNTNLTKTPDLDEMYPHVSPDGSKVCFVIDKGSTRRDRVRSVYYMNIDGTDKVEVSRNAREPCWSPDGKCIAYLKGEYQTYSTREYATSELMIYNIETKEHKPHPNKNLQHIYAICWAPNGKWFLGVIQGHIEYSDTILAFEANGTGVYNLEEFGVKGCRPDLRYDGKKVTWGDNDWELCIADIDLESEKPKVENIKKIINCPEDYKVYHVDFSPDGKYIAFSYGSFDGGQQVGGFADGWDICVTDLSGKWVKVTTDGKHNKEPDWVPIPAKIEKPKNPYDDIASIDNLRDQWITELITKQ
jgi:WD40 repeat protein